MDLPKFEYVENINKFHLKTLAIILKEVIADDYSCEHAKLTTKENHLRMINYIIEEYAEQK